MKALVTGSDGFIGKHLVRFLRAGNAEVVEVDRRNGIDVKSLVTSDLDGVDIVFHLAARPGVGPSWRLFDEYLADNLSATRALLQVAAGTGIKKFVYASSSSVYGRCAEFPQTEETPCMPVSPYGVTKLAMEALCNAYHSEHGVPTVGMRYFTVYGPGQRPDMAFHKFITAMRDEEPFVTVIGSGHQTRDFTYVGDAVRATMLAGTLGKPGTVYNVAGGSRISVLDAVDMIQELIGIDTVFVRHVDNQAGNPKRTKGDCARAHEELGWAPIVPLRLGLAEQIRSLGA